MTWYVCAPFHRDAAGWIAQQEARQAFPERFNRQKDIKIITRPEHLRGRMIDNKDRLVWVNNYRWNPARHAARAELHAVAVSRIMRGADVQVEEVTW